MVCMVLFEFQAKKPVAHERDYSKKNIKKRFFLVVRTLFFYKHVYQILSYISISLKLYAKFKAD